MDSITEKLLEACYAALADLEDLEFDVIDNYTETIEQLKEAIAKAEKEE